MPVQYMQIKPSHLRSSMIPERLIIVWYCQAVRIWNCESSPKASLLVARQHIKYFLCIYCSNPGSWKYSMCLYYTFLQHLTAHFAAVSKWNVQRVALKHTFNTWPWHVFITGLVPLIYIYDWIAHCVLNCRQAVKPPEVFEPPSYYSPPAESTIESQLKHWPKITQFELN